MSSLLQLVFVLLLAWNISGIQIGPKSQQGTCGKLVALGGSINYDLSFMTFDLATKNYSEVQIGASPYTSSYFSHQTNLQYIFNPDNAVTVDASSGVVTNYANWKTPHFSDGGFSYVMIICGVDKKGNIYGFFPIESGSKKYNVYQGNPSQGWVAINSFVVPLSFGGVWISGSVDNWGGNLLLSIYNKTNAQVISFNLQSREWAAPVDLDTTNVKEFQPFLFSALSHSTVLMNTNLGVSVFSLSEGGKLKHSSWNLGRPSLFRTDGWVVPNSNWTLLSGCGSYSTTNLTVNLAVASDVGVFKIPTGVVEIPNAIFWNVCAFTWSAVGCTQEKEQEEEKGEETRRGRGKVNPVTLN